MIDPETWQSIMRRGNDDAEIAALVAELQMTRHQRDSLKAELAIAWGDCADATCMACPKCCDALRAKNDRLLEQLRDTTAAAARASLIVVDAFGARVAVLEAALRDAFTVHAVSECVYTNGAVDLDLCKCSLWHEGRKALRVALAGTGGAP